jgi:PAS domain S-box-containing protein
MPFRKQIEHLEYRRVLWQYVIGALKTVHRHRLPGRRFGSDIELLAVYGAATVVCFSRGNFGASSAIAKYLGMPRETVRRRLCQLVELGLLQRAGRKFALTAATRAMPRNVIEILSDQTLGAATIAKTGHHQLRQEVMISLGVDMDSPALLWACKPDGTGMIHNPAWCDHYGMSLEEAVTGWMNTPHPDDKPALLEPWLKSLATGTPYEAEVRRRDRTGEYHWYGTRAVPVFKNGKIVKWCGVNTEFDPRLR